MRLEAVGGWATTLALALVAGCHPRGDGAGPTIRPLDSLELAEPDSLESFLALRTQAFTGRGDLLIETGTSILQFDRAGRLVRTMGRPGNGPGEFVRISTILVPPGDSLVAAVDARRARIVVFGLDDGRLRREVTVRPFFPDQQWRLLGDTVVMPGKLSPTPITSWVQATDSVWSWGEAPPALHEAMSAYSQGEPSIARRDEGWLALFPAEAPLYLLDRSGRIKGTVALPTRRRTGVPAGLADSLAHLASFHYAQSLAMAIHRRANGDYLVVHLDADARLDSLASPASGGRLLFSNLRYWVSLISADLRRACVDGLTPLDPDNMIAPFFRGDTLYFLPRTVDAGGGLRTVLHWYAVDDAGCDWLPTGGPRRADGAAP
jgi:6-bladed beta-propeller